MGQKEKSPACGGGKGRKGHNEQAGRSNPTAKAKEQPGRPATEHEQRAVPLPEPDNDAALSFLARWSPEGPWALTAIRPDKKMIHGRLFRKEQFQDMTKWIAEHNGKFNIYFSVNPVMREFQQKASRADIKSMDWLHVDIDARPANPDWSAERIAQHLEDEFSRIYAQLTTDLPAWVPPPSVIVFSGGGYQAFWKLTELLLIDGRDALYEDAKLYNVQLETLFEGDNCHNVDRIMRLPGTVNIPDAKKLKKGRKPALAKEVKFAADIAYPLDRFIKAAPAQIAGGTDTDADTDRMLNVSAITGNVERLSDVSDLDKWEVSDRIKVIIVQGHHPEETKEDNSRSSWLFDVICNLYRKSVPEDVIYSIITDKDFGVSASVLDKGTNAEKYALRQMARAKEEIIEPWLRKLNELHFIVENDGGKCRVMEEIEDPNFQNRPRLTRQSFEDFRNRYMNQFVRVGEDSEGKPVWAPVGKWWLNHGKRRQFRTIVFAPLRVVTNAYNLWRGYAFPERPGNKHESFLQHVRENICRGNEENYRYLLGWMARAVQFPGEQGHVAVVLRGKKGVGKGVLATHFGKLFGRHFLHISNASHLVGNFNAHLRDCIILFADEAFYAGDKKHDGILKTLVTENTLTIEAKGVDIVQSPNYLHIIMSTNDNHAVRASEDERRYFVLDVGSDKQQNSAYFAGIQADLLDGGYENLLHYLKTYDLSGFEVRDVPKTDALRDQQVHTRPKWLNVIVAMAEDAVSPDHDGWKKKRQPDWVSTNGILEMVALDSENRALQMEVNAVLRTLVTGEEWKADAKCVCQEGRAPIPIKPNANYPSFQMRRVQRRMFRLKPVAVVRKTLEEAGIYGNWKKGESVEWQLRKDEDAPETG